MFGNKDARTVITIISNPFCEGCRDAHLEIAKLLKYNREDICVQYIFYSYADFVVHSCRFLIGAFLYNFSNVENIYNTWYTQSEERNNLFLKYKHPIEVKEAIVGQDVEFWFRYLLATNKITYADFILYNRRYRKGSVTTSNITKNIKDRIDNFHTLLEISLSNPYLYTYLMDIYIPYNCIRANRTQDSELIQYLIKKLDELMHYEYDCSQK